MPFEIPESWAWVKLGDISNYGSSIHCSVDIIDESAWILELEDIEKDSGKILHAIIKKDKEISGVRNCFSRGQVLYSKLRTYLNKVLVAPLDGYCTTEIIPFSLYGSISPSYITHVLRSAYFVDYTTQCCYGCKMPRLGTSDALNGLIPLPPIAEQKRIVTEIEQWFLQIDDLETNEQNIKDYIKLFKNKILDLALNGKLVTQNSSDELSNLLLKRINTDSTSCDTSHYENLPATWQVTTLKDVAKTVSVREYQILQSKIQKEGLFPVVSQSANYIEGYSNQSKKVYKHETPVIVFGDHTRAVKYIDFDFIIGADGVKVIVPLVNPKYLYYLVRYASEQIKDRGYGRHFGYLTKYPIPIAPLVEQTRIVTKIDELFNIIDSILTEL